MRPTLSTAGATAWATAWMVLAASSGVASGQFGGPAREAKPKDAGSSSTSVVPAGLAPGVAVEPAAYIGAAWPDHNHPRALSGRDVQGKPLPTKFGTERFLTEPPENLESKVLVLDFWATWCGPCRRAFPALSKLQREFRDDVAIVAVSGQSEGEAAVREYLLRTPSEFFYAHDPRQRVYRSLWIRAIPHVVIVSTDGVVRWQGNPLDPRFSSALRRIVRVDPLVAAHRSMRASSKGKGDARAD